MTAQVGDSLIWNIALQGSLRQRLHFEYVTVATSIIEEGPVLVLCDGPGSPSLALPVQGVRIVQPSILTHVRGLCSHARSDHHYRCAY